MNVFSLDEESAGSRGYATIHEDMDNKTDENESGTFT